MNSTYLPYRWMASLILFALTAASPLLAQEGKLIVHATPKQAYVFVDGHALGQAGHALKLSSGDHKLEVVNYGYTPASQSVSIVAGETAQVTIALAPNTNNVSGPWGAMTIEGADHNAVLLNGKTPDFFVGQADEFNHEWGWKQELVVPPGTYLVSVLGGDKEVWSGSVDVPADQRVVIDVPKGVRKTVPWTRAQKLSSSPRFKAGTASATVAVAKPVAQLATSTAQINCGDTAQLQWSASDAPQVEISNLGGVAPTGSQGVQPKQSTTYDLSALGPGGKATTSTTVNVDNTIRADLSLSQPQIQYKRVGDKVVDQGTTSLNWSASNADTVSIDPIGSVSANGNRSIPAVPQKSDFGPVDETVTYTLNASNPCGGKATQTATLHIVGTIEDPAAGLAFNSVYFPTDVPRSVTSPSGLVESQQATLESVAQGFKKFLEYKPDAHLILTGHADERGDDQYNRDLSERRAETAKTYLTGQGIPADNLETKGVGKEENLSEDQVKQSVEQDPSLSDEDRQKVLQHMHTLVLANNRRVDITLSTDGRESARRYPFKAGDYAILVDRNGTGAERNGGVVAASQRTKIEN
jgi:outer membrane protein OmpA-like peptidoglycan-associated protein